MNSLQMHGRNNGKKLMAVRIVKHCFEIIHLLTGDVSAVKSRVALGTVDTVHVRMSLCPYANGSRVTSGVFLGL